MVYCGTAATAAGVTSACMHSRGLDCENLSMNFLLLPRLLPCDAVPRSHDEPAKMIFVEVPPIAVKRGAKSTG